jgi:phosphoglycerate dehydrogenase-like enzyme
LTRLDVVATSHIAGVTDVSYRGIARGVAANIVRILSGQAPYNCVNWEALGR